ncbi:hypothetical protein MGU_08681 [Metarhizium guizhouense ARSEF 977]|uniref:Tat pathway signal sequence n=1 Tax=Metarhizium guizhouense (strain ARSEF 977) TaxID=1276136 RepID=A0A0B4GN98_METGA|nr:hypothetical protein MGU_08681 [Metarhizium guizhouense ARSEF 977]
MVLGRRGSICSERHDEDGLLANNGRFISKRVTSSRWLFILILGSLALNVVLLCIIFLHDHTERLNRTPQLLYSPAQDAILYEVKKFHRGFGDKKTVYQGDPSPEVDKVWKSLYNEIGISRISREQAELLPNRTYPFIGDEGDQNAIRIALSKDYYQTVLSPEEFDDVQGSYGRDHISHCLDAVREAIMCASDISVITWQWNDQAKKALGHGDVLHTCRSFEKIKEWAAENQALVDFKADVFVTGDPVVDGVD